MYWFCRATRNSWLVSDETGRVVSLPKESIENAGLDFAKGPDAPYWGGRTQGQFAAERLVDHAFSKVIKRGKV